MILVTGVSGFIGNHLLKGLIARHGRDQILALSSKPVAECAYLLHNDYQFDSDYFTNTGYHEISTIVHAGAFIPKNAGDANNVEACNSNVTYLHKLLSAHLPRLSKFIFFSTVDVYQGDGEISETSVVNPVSLYGHSKLYGEKMAQAWVQQNNRILQILRIGHVYGPGEEVYQKLIPATFKRLANGQPIEMWGEGNEVRSFIYVQDVVEAIMQAAALSKSEGVINVAGEEQITVRELIQKLISITGINATVDQKVATAKGRDLRFDVSKLQKYLLPTQTPLEKGLREEWNYMKQLSK